MKRETLRHPKTYDLAARLGCSRATALGYLTLLWDYTADMAIRGDVGKWADGAIAGACDYVGSAECFIEALIEAGWLDRDPAHRLIIHDWPDHCERWVKLKMGKIGLDFLPSYSVVGSTVTSTNGSTEHSTDASAKRSPPRDRTEPNRTEPNPPPNPPIRTGNPSNDRIAELNAGGEGLLKAMGVRECRAIINTIAGRGCSLADLKAVVQHWSKNAGAWGAGALVDRLMLLDPGQDPTTLWPTPSKEFHVATSHNETSRNYAKLVATHEAQLADYAASEQRKAVAEKRYGAYLDSLSNDQVRAITMSRLPDEASFVLRGYRGGPPKGVHRESLLLDLAKADFVPPDG